ncbi:hypothetical protein QZH41_005572 [Actinostola sp. cb2023]|nr:hypothetical protein QZH41_005572 [Actinostola sp. cb2023]
MEPQGNLDSDANAIVHRTTRKSREKIDKPGTKSERIYQLKRTRAGMKASVTKIRNELQLLMSDYKNIDLFLSSTNSTVRSPQSAARSPQPAARSPQPAARFLSTAQTTPKAENESTKRGTTTPKVSEDSPPFSATRRESTKNTERNFTDETTLRDYESPDKGAIQPTATGLQQQQQSLLIQELLEQQRQHTNALTLPQTELPVFTGDPIEYCGFIRAFENLIETKTTSSNARLYYLIQFTEGDVQELMRSCLPMEANEGYAKARELLKSRYGQNYKISAAYAERIMKAPQIKAEDGRALQQFSVLLTTCRNTLNGIGCINKIENPDTLQKIVEKLPFALRQRWRDVDDNITEEQNREITIKDLTDFVDKKARAANHPLFGKLTNSAQESKHRNTTTVESRRKPAPPTTRSSYATHGEPVSNKSNEGRNIPKCLLCNEQHWLSRCGAFKEKSLEERIKFTRGKGLYSTRNDPVPEMIPEPEMIPKMTKIVPEMIPCPKRSPSSTRNDPQIILGMDLKWRWGSFGAGDHFGYNFGHLGDHFGFGDHFGNGIISELPQINSTDIDLLIGNDVPKALEPKQVKESQDGGPYAIRTLLGWTINGPLGRKGVSNRTSNRIEADVLLNEQFKQYCNMEFNDTNYHDETTMSQEDIKALNSMKDSAKIVEGHYEIALPWRSFPPDLPNNKIAAERRLELLKKRFTKDEVLHANYTKFMEDLVNKGYAQKLPNENVYGDVTSGWYLPHHPVTNPRKPEKTRVVFDCAANYGGTSLNKKLMQGPDLTNSLVGVLTRFRQESTAVMGDIESMFYQVHVRSEDSNYLRYLWWPGGDLNKTPEQYQMTADDNKANFSPEAVETVKRNFYVDDCLKSVDGEQEAIRLVDELHRLLARGGFRLTKWVSNSRCVLDSIPEPERAGSVKTLDFDHVLIERALGILWDVQPDTLGFKIAVKEKPATRRGILSVVSSIYDPLGFVSPLLQAKILLQELCRRGLGWDDVVCQEELERWRSWLQELPKLETLKFDRCLKPKDFGDVVSTQLHTFSDASDIGYGAVSYLRLVNTDGQIHCAFVLSKARLAPLKQMTIPRLELSAATTATRLSNMIVKEIDLPIDNVKFWTDSTCVLSYILNQEKRFKTFVANKIAFIHETTEPIQWNYVNTNLNVADDTSRGLRAEDLVNSARWKQGPDFLWKSEEHWPQQPELNITIDDNDSEVKRETKTFTVSSSDSPDVIDRMILHFSSWFKLKKYVAWILRYRSKVLCASRKRKRQEKVTFATVKPQPITTEELQHAEKEILTYVQKLCFAGEMSSFVKKSSQLHKLNPLKIDGLLRVGGRLRNAPIAEEAMHPILLPKKHHVVNLIVRHYHELSGHSGVEHVLALTRERFWPINARATVKKVVNTCFSCRKRNAPPGIQKMADLPDDRVKPDKPPFTYVGIDCFGPFIVKRGRTEVKRYGIVYTCLTIRAIHIEILHSMDTHSFINSFRRFAARRGVP